MRYRFGAFEVDIAAKELRKGGVPLKLGEQPFKVLTALLERPGEEVRREELQQRIWPNGTYVDFDKGLNSAVNKLRDALTDSADRPRYIETVPRRGYRFVAAVNEINPEAAFVRRSASAPPSLEPESSSRWRRLSIRSLLLVALAILAPIITLVLTRDLRYGGRQQKPTSFPVIESLAVLPLENLSHDPEQMYFVDAMTDALILNLGKIGALRVISRTSAMQYKQTPKRLHEIAKELDVEAVVEGSVLRSRDRVRITLRLVEAATDRQLWAQSYEGEVQDVLALQSKVATDVAREIKVAVTSQGGVPLVRGKPVNPEAYDMYLKGDYHLRKRDKEGFRNAMAFFERAIEQDPNYASAYVGLANVYDMLAGYALLPPREAYPKARAAAMEALELDDQLAEAHTALAKVKARYDWDWQGAEREFLRGIELNPGYAPGHQWYAYYHLAPTGQYDRAIAELEQAKRLDPLSAIINTDLGLVLGFAGKNERAREQLQNALEIDPDFSFTHGVLGRIYFHDGMLEAAIEEFQKAVRLSEGKLNDMYLGWLGQAYGAAGREQEARKMLGILIELRRKQYVPFENIAQVHAGLGEKTQALGWLEKAYQERAALLFGLKMDPKWHSLRADPKFQELIRRIGLDQ